MHYRALRNKHQRNEFFPCVRRSAETVEARRERAKLGEAKSVRRQYFLRRGFFPRRSNFLAVAAAAARNRG